MNFEVVAYARLNDRDPEVVRVAWLEYFRRLKPIYDVRVTGGEDDQEGEAAGAPAAERLARAPAGFMALSDGLTADVSNDRPPGSKDVDAVRAALWLKEPRDDQVQLVLDTLLEWSKANPLAVASAGAEDERREHMFVSLKIQGGSVDTVAGKNFRQYLPGLFWWNVWNRQLVQRLAVDLRSVPKGWDVSCGQPVGAGDVLVSGRYCWREWRACSSLAAAWAASQSSVFSKRRLEAALPANLNAASALRFLRQWK